MPKETIDIIHVLKELIDGCFLLIALYSMWAVLTGKIKIDIKITTKKKEK